MTDHLGSTVALADANGAITSSTSYDSFGNAAPKQAAGSAASSTGKAASGAGSAASSTGNAASNIATTYRYTGREYDEDTGLYYYRNRWYDPEVGRFISEDPIGFAGGDINLYGYVGNNPQNFVDPFGYSACSRQKGEQKQDKQQKLPKCIRDYLVDHWKKDRKLVEKITYTRSDPITLKLESLGGTSVWTIDAAAFTWGYNIDFHKEAFNAADGIDIDEMALAGHEFIHAEQYSKDENFTRNYVGSFVDQLLTNALLESASELWKEGWRQLSYERIPYEKKAMAFGKKIKRHIRDKGNPCVPNAIRR